MADQQDLDAHYTTMDKIFRLSLGEKGGYSGARFDGDFSLSLEQAQEKKHQFIMDNCNIKPGMKVLDIGCGWGAFIDFLNKKGVETTGVVLAEGQANACRKNGLNVHHMDSKKITPETFGMFDAVCAMGSPEHLCSVDEYRAGKQEEIYETYFKQMNALLPVGGRFYCQTMVFGPNMVKFEDIKFGETNVYKNRTDYSGEELMDLVCDVFPGSWLPYGQEGMERPAKKEHFKLIHSDSGRLDYIETIHRWTSAFNKWDLEKYMLYASLAPKLLNSDFRKWIRRYKIAPNLQVFEREIFEHYRMVYEKTA
ncbi:MAG: class I SAM-dependent methyltransferase [Flavobacteriales bacterium]|nr:class I SAM-dependent methyltransferase [Flavobacteriales bacterium]MBK6943935.1 class I SAM-dependent methyltransferase [Flavobacteriales bacterium]MBK7240143.1 class I SAM-dependent methyltransferase [Flavobacteriales bacterium]MBK9533606.1 class I SAM-dependent methyltransferase [Flavobacteriales bacterium]MBP9136896.1 class I SAM-dependent methyltransferase [Flavobacteriales bacterium]